MKKIGINLLIMVAITVVVLVGTLYFLDGYTNHDGTLVKVENLEGKYAQDAISTLKKQGLEGVITDTVYKDGAKKLSVINQNPEADQMVKEGRKVYLVINTNKVPMVQVPDLAGKTSLPQAKNILLRRHLKLGKVIKQINGAVQTRNDEPVLAQYESGTSKVISPGTLIERNSSIDLVVGVSENYFDAIDSTSNTP